VLGIASKGATDGDGLSDWLARVLPPTASPAGLHPTAVQAIAAVEVPLQAAPS
jgi:hypothetical protein